MLGANCLQNSSYILRLVRILSWVRNSFKERLAHQTEPCFKMTWTHWGLAGGSYFRSIAVLDAFAAEHVNLIDWKRIGEVEGAPGMFLVCKKRLL